MAGDRAHDASLEGWLRDNERMLGLTQSMIWRWRGIDSFLRRFRQQAGALKQRLEVEPEGR